MTRVNYFNFFVVYNSVRFVNIKKNKDIYFKYILLKEKAVRGLIHGDRITTLHFRLRNI